MALSFGSSGAFLPTVVRCSRSASITFRRSRSFPRRSFSSIVAEGGGEIDGPKKPPKWPISSMLDIFRHKDLSYEDKVLEKLKKEKKVAEEKELSESWDRNTKMLTYWSTAAAIICSVVTVVSSGLDIFKKISKISKLVGNKMINPKPTVFVFPSPLFFPPLRTPALPLVPEPSSMPILGRLMVFFKGLLSFLWRRK